MHKQVWIQRYTTMLSNLTSAGRLPRRILDFSDTCLVLFDTPASLFFIFKQTSWLHLVSSLAIIHAGSFCVEPSGDAAGKSDDDYYAAEEKLFHNRLMRICSFFFTSTQFPCSTKHQPKSEPPCIPTFFRPSIRLEQFLPVPHHLSSRSKVAPQNPKGQGDDVTYL